MKQILLICGLLLCITTIGYSQGQGATTAPPISRDVLQPTSNRPIGVEKTNSSVTVWFTALMGDVVVHVNNTTTGAIQSRTFYATNGSDLFIGVSVDQLENCKVTIRNTRGVALINNF